MQRHQILSHNRQAWDRRVLQGETFARPTADEDFQDPLLRLDPRGWLGNVVGKRILCLGAGGGKHGPLFAKAGAIATVVDLSPAQLELDRSTARKHAVEVRTIETSIDDLSPLYGEQFDLVVQPVSSCYVPDVALMYQEIAKLLLPGGVYVSQHKTPTSLQSRMEPTRAGYEVAIPYYINATLPEVNGSRLREAGTLEFLHRWEQLIGGLCRSGFIIEDLIEPRHDRAEAESGSFGHRAQFIAPYVRIKARRVDGSERTRLVLP
ncbi:MAG: hypothetical protein RJA70_4978 [Pseudomonadota bacterium]|jgi:SAM-dependent methyltransferase